MKQNPGLDDGKRLRTLKWRVAQDDRLEWLAFEKAVNQGKAQSVWPSGLHWDWTETTQFRITI
jgi:hypothetical protein